MPSFSNFVVALCSSVGMIDLYTSELVIISREILLNHKKLAITTRVYHCSPFLQQTKLPNGNV